MTKICDFPYPIYEGGGHDKEVASSKKVHSRLQWDPGKIIRDPRGEITGVARDSSAQLACDVIRA